MRNRRAHALPRKTLHTRQALHATERGAAGLRYDLRIYNEDSTMSALLWLIPLAIYIWVAHAGHHQKQTAAAYFWMAIIAIGVIGLIYTLITTGSIPAGCCGDE